MNQQNLAFVNNNTNPLTKSILTGAAAAAVASATVNTRRVKNKEVTVSDAVRETVKTSSQGAVATGAAVITADYLSKGNFLKAATSISLGIAGVLALEMVNDKFTQNNELEINENNLIEE